MARPRSGLLMEVYGHRGAAAAFPENTLPGLRAALDAGAAGVEFDVRLTADGVPVLLHDDDVARTTDGTGAASAQPWAALRNLDAGFRFGSDRGFPFRGRGLSIPTLDEALALVDVGARAIVEVKPAPGRNGIVRSVTAVLAAHARDRVVVSSFDPQMLERFRESLPSVETALLVPGAFVAAAGIEARRCGHRGLHVADAVADAAAVAAARELRLEIVVWTVNDPARARALAALGVDGIIADDPGSLMAALR